MPERYLVRCTAADGWAMAGIYSAGLTVTGMVATWQQERATRYDCPTAAAGAASRLAKKFRGTQWSAEPVFSE
ncbi:MAG: hypothetical protein HY777_04010 [Betaproteobacteria bacterium]|nr:hypothetical protein [Betaproteobacteria bacterium]